MLYLWFLNALRVIRSFPIDEAGLRLLELALVTAYRFTLVAVEFLRKAAEILRASHGL